MALPLRIVENEREALESEIRDNKKLIEACKINIAYLESRRCDECDPDGQIVDEIRIHSMTIDVPYKTCPVCGGTKVKQ